MSEERKKEVKEKIINQIVRVTTKNSRIFEGKLKAVDFRANLIIHECVAEIPDNQNCPINATLQNIMDSKLAFTPNPQKCPEEQEKEKQNYVRSHYYIGNVMISGTDIAKV